MIEIFGTPTCHKCIEAKDFLNRKGIPFTEYNVKEDAIKKLEMVNATGQMGVPAIRIGENWYIGWNPVRFEEILKEASLA